MRLLLALCLSVPAYAQVEHPPCIIAGKTSQRARLPMENMQALEAKFSDVRSLTRWRSAQFSYQGTEQFVASPFRGSGVHTIYEAGLPIDVHADIKPGRPLVIVLNGNSPRGDALKLPVFAGFGIIPAGEVSRISISDPSLYLASDLTLAWYAGSRELKLQKILPKVIRRFVEIASPEKIIFLGGSGGGFASLYYSWFFSGSLAVVWNAQTNILAYAPTAVEKYGVSAFGFADIASTKACLTDFVDVSLLPLYADRTNKNYVLYMQNKSDWHTRSHLGPFLKARGHDIGSVGLVDSNLYIHMANWGDGHVPPPNPVLKSLLSQLSTYKGSWGNLFGDGLLQAFIETAEEGAQEVVTSK